MVRILVCAGVAVAVQGCSASGVDRSGPVGEPANPATFTDGGTPQFDPDSGGPGGGKTLVYAHTEKTIYEIDPTSASLPLTKVGDVDCLSSSNPNADSSLTDIAVSKDGALFGVSSNFGYALSIKTNAVHCDATWPLTGASVTDKNHPVFYGLTFAPIGTLSPSAEVLVAANSDGQLYTIDQTNGTTTLVGDFGVDPVTKKNWALSGDIVFLANGTSPIGFATVRTCTTGSSNCSTVDTLIEIDVAKIKPGSQSVLKAVRGALKKGSWCTSGSAATFSKMFGIAAFNDKIYGFSDDGDTIEIHNNDGSSCLVKANQGMHFKGAGVTTLAPVKAPDPL